MERARRFALLWSLYFVQGLPFGLQVRALPVILRERGLSLTGVGLAGALAAPWILKPLWAPLVDRYGSAAFGRRKSWIVPMQLCLALSCAVAATLPTGALQPLLVTVLAMNLFAATMDIAVDGLAIDMLSERDLGKGNIAQVVGYKLGMLTGGGLLLWLSGRLGQRSLFWVMAGLVIAVMVTTLPFREPRSPTLSDQDEARPDQGRAKEAIGESFRALWKVARQALRSQGALWLLAIVASYKLGESMSDAMFKPFLVDRGFSREQIGLWVGTWGMGASILGSIAGGLAASRISIYRALGWAAALRCLPLLAQWWLVTRAEPGAAAVIAITAGEHFFGGALTTAMFAFMMSRVDRRIGATHFTLLAAVEVLGKSPPSLLSGVVGDRLGYGWVFGGATVLSMAFLALLALAREALAANALPARSPTMSMPSTHQSAIHKGTPPSQPKA